jgi:hypothetical protein
MLQRAGRIQDPTGVMNMGPGALVPECPACPFPGRNLDENWRTVPPSMQYAACYVPLPMLTLNSRWLYEKVCSVDACFKLSLKGNMSLAKRTANDPELQSGYGVFVEETQYKDILAKHPQAHKVRSLHALTFRDVSDTFPIIRIFQHVEQTSMRLKMPRDEAQGSVVV